MCTIFRLPQTSSSQQMIWCLFFLTFSAFAQLILIEIILDTQPSGIRKCAPYKCQPTFNHTTNEWLDQHIAALPEAGWRKAHQSQSNELLDPNQQCQYVFIGDSITYGWRSNQESFDRNFNEKQSGVIYAQDGDKIHERA